jgi:hypothetical protein
VSITPTKPHDELSIVAARLSRAAPNMWEEFVKAFDVYAATVAGACVHAASDKVLNAQGRAQQCADLSSLLKNANQRATELAAKHKIGA